MKEQFQKLLNLIKLEKEEDLEQFRKKVQELPLSKRKERGVTWYPLQVLRSGYTYGERAFVIVERTSELGKNHQFRSGKTVNFYSNQPGVKTRDFSGVVNYVNKDRMKIILNSKDLPDWLKDGNLGIDLLFDDRTYLEMEKALNAVMSASGNRLAELRDILVGKLPPRVYPVSDIEIPHLNESQNAAIKQVRASGDITVVHGPPGTGKTTTLVQAIKALTQTESTVLVCAPSNSAVDLLTLRCTEAGMNTVRIGNISRVDEEIIRHTLEMRLSEHPESKNIKKIKIQAAAARRNALKWKRNFGREQAMSRKEAWREVRELEDWANQLEDRIIDQMISGAQVITCTLVGAAHSVLQKYKFRTVVIDEAAQALEPATWIPILKASKVVLAGDPYQLPPTVKAIAAQRGGLHITLIEKLLKILPAVNLLTTQYRMHEDIMGFSNQRFYGGELKAADEVARHSLDIGEHKSIIFIDTAGCGFEEKVNTEAKSRYNPEEFQILCEHLYWLRDKFEERILPKVGLISPYRQQVLHMKEAIEDDEGLQDFEFSINSIDGFQGQERDVVYISLVRSNGKGEIGFLNDYRRMNVAMTRAKKLLVVVGDSATVGQHKFYSDFLEYVEQNGEYKTAWEFMQIS